MTDTPNPQTQDNPQTAAQTPPVQESQQQQSLSPEQWNQFLGNLTAQNQQLQSQVSSLSAQNTERAIRERQTELDSLPDKERADKLQGEINAIRQAGQAAQAQELSNSVWQRRDADAAARLLTLHGFNGTEPELYRGSWDVNWMPRFVASVEGLVKGKQQTSSGNSNPNHNPANRANVGTSTSSALPEIDPNASGFDTIRFALARGKQ